MPHLSAERRVLRAEPESRKPPGERARWPGRIEDAQLPSRPPGGFRNRPPAVCEVESAIRALQLALINRAAAAPRARLPGPDRGAELQALALELLRETARISRLVWERERRG